MCCDILSVDCTGEWFWGLFSGRFLVRSNFLVIRGLRRSLDFRAVSGYWDSRSGSGMTIVMWRDDYCCVVGKALIAVSGE